MEPVVLTIVYVVSLVALGAAVGLLAWSIVGFAVAVFAYFTQPPRRTTAGACGACSDLHALWDGMNSFEKFAACLNFAFAKLICDSQGCPVNLDP